MERSVTKFGFLRVWSAASARRTMATFQTFAYLTAVLPCLFHSTILRSPHLFSQKLDCRLAQTINLS